MTDETYNTEEKCKNCKRTNYINKIPRGTTVEEFLDDKKLKCTTCGCPLYKEKEDEK